MSGTRMRYWGSPLNLCSLPSTSGQAFAVHGFSDFCIKTIKVLNFFEKWWESKEMFCNPGQSHIIHHTTPHLAWVMTFFPASFGSSSAILNQKKQHYHFIWYYLFTHTNNVKTSCQNPAFWAPLPKPRGTSSQNFWDWQEIFAIPLQSLWYLTVKKIGTFAKALSFLEIVESVQSQTGCCSKTLGLSTG